MQSNQIQRQNPFSTPMSRKSQIVSRKIKHNYKYIYILDDWFLSNDY